MGGNYVGSGCWIAEMAMESSMATGCCRGWGASPDPWLRWSDRDRLAVAERCEAVRLPPP